MFRLKIVRPALLTILFIPVLIYGQGLKPDEIGGGFVATHLDANGASTSAGPGFELYAAKNLSPNFSISAGTGFYMVWDEMLTKSQSANTVETIAPLLELKANYYILPEESFSPYLFAGLTAFGRKRTRNNGTDISNADLAFDGGAFAGGGIRFKINEKLSLTASADYRYIFTDANDPKAKYWAAKMGVSYALGSSSQQREQMEYPVDDDVLADLFGAGDTRDTQPSSTDSDTQGNSEDDALATLFGESEDTTQQEEQANDPLAELFGDTEEDTTPDVDKGEQEALSLLFNEDEAGSKDTAPSGGEVDQLLAKITELRELIQHKDERLDNLQRQVEENKKMLAGVSGTMAREYTADVYGDITVDNYKRNYERALQMHYNKEYGKARQLFSTLLSAFPNHKLASNCQYWIGEGYNAAGQYSKAISAFNDVLAYSKSYKFDDALIMTGLINMRMGRDNVARNSFQKLVSDYPDSEYAPKAMRYLGRL